VRPGRWRPHLLATKAWVPPGPLRAPRALQARPVPPGRWPLRGPDRRSSERRRRALRPEGLAPLRPCGQAVPLAAAALLDAVEHPPAPAQVVRWTGAAPRWVPLPGSAHCELARTAATRPEVIRRVAEGQ